MGENIQKSGIWNSYLEYIMNSYDSMVKKKKRQPDENWANAQWMDIFLKKIYKYPMSTWEDAQHLYPSEKCKSELQNTTSMQLGWL